MVVGWARSREASWELGKWERFGDFEHALVLHGEGLDGCDAGRACGLHELGEVF